MSRWLLEDHLSFTEVSPPELIWLGEHSTGYCYCYTFTVPHSEKIRITGVCVADLAQADHDSHVRLLTDEAGRQEITNPKLREAIAAANVRVLLSYREGALPHPHKLVSQIDRKRINVILGPDVIGQPRGDQIGGISLEIEKDKLDGRVKGELPFGYYVTNGLGIDLYSRVHDSDNQAARTLFALLVSVDRDESGKRVAQVWGIAKLDDIAEYQHDKAFFALDESLRLWSLKEYEYYINDFTTHRDSDHPDGDKVYILWLGPPVEISPPVPLQSLFSKSLPDRSDELGLPTCYVSRPAINKLKKQHESAFHVVTARAEHSSNSNTHLSAGRVALALANALDAVLDHDITWFGPGADEEVTPTQLIKSLTVPLRDRAIAAEAERENEKPRGQRSKVARATKSLFDDPNEDEVDVTALVQRVEEARRFYTERTPEADIHQLAWQLRFAAGDLLAASIELKIISFKDKHADAARRLLPTSNKFRDRLRQVFLEPTTAFFHRHGDQNDRIVGRRRVLEQIVGISPEPFIAAIRIGDLSGFVSELLSQLTQLGDDTLWDKFARAIEGEEVGGKARFALVRSAIRALPTQTAAQNHTPRQVLAAVAEVVVDVFSREEFERLLRTSGIPKYELPDGGTFLSFAEGAVEWYRRRGRVEDLLGAVVKVRPQAEARLRDFREDCTN